MQDWICNFHTGNFLNLTPGSGPIRLFQVLKELLGATLLGWEFWGLFAKAFRKVCKACESSSCAVVLRALLRLFRLLDVVSSWGSTIGSMVLASSACPLPSLPIGPMIWWRRRRRDHAMRFMRTMWMIMRLNMGSENPNAFFCFPSNHAIYLVVLSAVTPRTLPTICQSKKRAMITIPTSPWRRTIRHIISRGPWNSIQHQLLFCRIIPILRALNTQVEVGLVRCCSARGRQIGENRHGQAPVPTDGNPMRWKAGPKWMRWITPQLVTSFYLSVILAQDPKWRHKEEDYRSTWQETMKRMQNSQ